MERLRKFNMGNGSFTTALFGVKRKALWAGWVECQIPGCRYANHPWLDRISKFPHTPTCPDGHAQMGANGMPIKIESDQAEEIVRWGLYRDIAAAGAMGSHVQLGKHDNIIDPLEFFSQGVNQSTLEDKLVAKRLKSLR